MRLFKTSKPRSKTKFLPPGKDLFIFIGIIAVSIAAAFGVWNYYYRHIPQHVLIITEKPVYPAGGDLRLAVKNILPNDICFSACYPYYLEGKWKEWKTYDYYENCPRPDLTENCLEPDYAKFFSITLPDLASGLHRVQVPVAISAKVGEEFRKDKIYYSNDFIIR